MTHARLVSNTGIYIFKTNKKTNPIKIAKADVKEKGRGVICLWTARDTTLKRNRSAGTGRFRAPFP